MQHRRRAAAAVTLLCCFYAPLRLSVSVLAPRAHPVPAAATQPLPAAGNATGLLELILLGLASSSEAALTGHADVHWHPAYAEERERACVHGEHNCCRTSGFLSQAYAFVAALLELLQQLLASVHQQSRCNARYRTPGEICRQAEFAGELARAASAHKEPPPPCNPNPAPAPTNPYARTQVFGEVGRLRRSRLWRFSYGACSVPYHAIISYHVRTSLETILPAGPSVPDAIDKDGPEAWAMYLDRVRTRESVRERGRRRRAERVRARGARQRAVRQMGRLEPPAAPNRGRARRLAEWRDRRWHARWTAVLALQSIQPAHPQHWPPPPPPPLSPSPPSPPTPPSQSAHSSMVGGGDAKAYRSTLKLMEGGKLSMTTKPPEGDGAAAALVDTVTLVGTGRARKAAGSKQPVVLSAAAIEARLQLLNPVMSHPLVTRLHCTVAGVQGQLRAQASKVKRRRLAFEVSIYRACNAGARRAAMRSGQGDQAEARQG